MSEDDVRAMILRKAKRHIKKKGGTGVTVWGKVHGLPRGHLSEFMNGQRGPVTAILDALGLEWRICRKRKSA